MMVNGVALASRLFAGLFSLRIEAQRNNADISNDTSCRKKEPSKISASTNMSYNSQQHTLIKIYKDTF